MKINNHQILIFFLSVLFIFQGILGLRDLNITAYAGYEFGANRNIIKIEENSPAAKANLQIGDKIISINGVAVKETKARIQQPEPKIGEMRTLVMERDGVEKKIALTYGPLSESHKKHWYLSFFIGLIFLLVSWWISLRFTSGSATLASYFLVFFGASNFPTPIISNVTLESIFGIINISIFILGFILLVDFLLHFPKKKAFRQHFLAKWLLYLPGVLLISILMWWMMMLPDSTEGSTTFLRLIIAGIVLFYVCWAILLLVQTLRGYNAIDRTFLGVNLLFIGLLIGLVPILMMMILLAFFPNLSTSGVDNYYAITTIAIPICIALAIRKNENSSNIYNG